MKNIFLGFFFAMIFATCKSRPTPSDAHDYNSTDPQTRIKEAEKNLDLAKAHYNFTALLANYGSCTFDVSFPNTISESIAQKFTSNFSLASDFSLGNQNHAGNPQWMKDGEFVQRITVDIRGFYYLELYLSVPDFDKINKSTVVKISSAFSSSKSTGPFSSKREYSERAETTEKKSLNENMVIPIKWNLKAPNGQTLDITGKFVCSKPGG